VKSSAAVSQLRKLPSAAGSSVKREASSASSGISLVLKKPRLASQTFTPLGRVVEADRRASPTTQVYLYEEIAAEGLTFLLVAFSASVLNKHLIRGIDLCVKIFLLFKIFTVRHNYRTP